MGDLCAAALLLLTIEAAARGGVLVGEPSPGAVRLGDTVTLPCDLQLTHETTWFTLRNGTLSVGVFASRNPGEQQERPFTYKRRPDSRFSLVLNPSTNSSSLRIEGVTETDQGLYYCAAKDKGGINIGNGTWLRLSAGGRSPSRPQARGECSTLPEWVTPVSALLSALLSSACVYCLCRGKGGADSAEPRNETQTKGRKTATMQPEEGGELQYATLEIREAPRRTRNKPSQNPEFCTYSDIIHGRRA
ncbi:uncharacterized protein [Lepisosteus oculatus]|uniref:uncharacterized protein n=1 Tax=Lepisosteus oculatus TaxID=7918 RepID=UPI0035F5120C